MREQELERKKDNIRRVEQCIKDLVAENPDLERKLLSLESDKSVPNLKCREMLGWLCKAQTTERKCGAVLRWASECDHYYYTQCKFLSMQNKKITMTNRNQEQEIKALRDSNLEIRTKLETRVAQLNKFTGEMARKTQRVNTSAIRDDEYFEKEFSGLATDIRNWSFTHFFHSETLVPRLGAVTGGLGDDIREIAGQTDLPEIFKNRATSRRAIAGLLADRLRKELFHPLLLGLLPEEFARFENLVEMTGEYINPLQAHKC